MAASLHPALWASIWLAAVPFVFYIALIGLGVIPFFQRHFLYAHTINSLLWSDLNSPMGWGFAKNQVTPFGLQTSDGETIYAWHIMPLPLYLQHETTVATQDVGFCSDFTQTESFRLLSSDPEARLIISCNTNAGHIAQNTRPASYHALTDTSSYHVIAIDYRGFGHSTGKPNEKGLILDAAAVVDWAINVAGVPSNRIVLLGHSLGTAVASGVAERYTLQGIEFAGIVLVAGFSDLATMLSGYRFGGIVPALGPFAFWPSFHRVLDRVLVDKWHSANRLANIVRHSRKRLRISLVHAKNDKDIPWVEDNKLFRAAAEEAVGILNDDEFISWKETRTVRTSNDSFVTTWKTGEDTIIRQELFPYGGHNDILGFAPVSLAIMRSFELEGTAYN
ncbi:alpha/beta-hydrolase [Trichoderma citrinoviride]|uniref:Alpha/beta-hydrolase n=1 Tax=Trichoderma citrinoviride TaxID=58853 RepID=A0A2T4BHQ4_9HYPO|nr:alpha/beta-hydrolase [Trichoderma citrinoviride]PTB68779.1 alpha/beta-hydrolase [Trichoderma citrinoviride]